jgi:hypothetical protein
MIKRHRKVKLIVLLVLASSLALAAIVLGQAAGTLDLSWSTIAGGGGESEGGRYAVRDSLGQGIASSDPSTDGDRFSLTDGFWQSGSTETTIYLPLVNNNQS